jgi:hypothetical protein
VNGEDSGVIEGTGSKHVSVTFYAHADKNQMPLRNIVIDWGDDMKGVSPEIKWPNGHKSGSDAETNFYKNRRGLDNSNPPKEICSSGATEFGKVPEACSSSYVLFTNDYVCTNSDVAKLKDANRLCGSIDPKTKSIITSPCYDVDDKGDASCVFQPRIHAKDNWGWCTGYCDAGSDNTNSCFDGSTLTGTPPSGLVNTNECDIPLYPCGGSGSCKDKNGKIINPWTYFDGKIKIKPVQ